MLAVLHAILVTIAISLEWLPSIQPRNALQDMSVQVELPQPTLLLLPMLPIMPSAQRETFALKRLMAQYSLQLSALSESFKDQLGLPNVMTALLGITAPLQA